MFLNEINAVTEAALKKEKLLKKSRKKYLVAAALAGMYVGFAIILIFTIGGMFTAANLPAAKLVMGLCFPIALSLVLLCGSELYTGTNLIMMVGSLEKKVSWGSTVKIWLYSFFGNFIGAIILSVLFVASGLTHGATGDYFLKMAEYKMHQPFIELFIRGIFCNILVCAAVWACYKLKEETAKLIMIFWCLFAFLTAGFEHSVANMTTFTTALLMPHKASINFYGLAYNLTAVGLGNLAGGAIFIGLAYWYVSKEKK